MNVQKKNNLKVFEYQKLKLNTIEGFTDQHLKSLSRYHSVGGSKYYNLIHNGVQFKQYVGAMKVGNLTIEILPKIDRNNDVSDDQLWRNVLVTMLQSCKKLTTDTLSEAHLSIHKKSILDIYIKMFITEVQSLINRGLIKQYQKQQNNYTALKGKLLFDKNIQKNITRKERFFCEKNEYLIDHTIHQILKQAIDILYQVCSEGQKIKLKQIGIYFEKVGRKSFCKEDFNQLRLNRKSLPYKKGIDLAKMFVLNYSPNIAKGKHEMICLMFDMNMLWEEYIYRILNKNKPANTTVSFQNSNPFWEDRNIRPDIVITRNENGKMNIQVIDTKWKIRSNTRADDNDLKQMFAYNLLWNANKSLLLYPQSYQTNTNHGSFHYIPNGQNENKCKMGYISILGDKAMKPASEISREIFNLLE